MITLICVTALLITVLICVTTLKCTHYKYRITNQPQVTELKEDEQEAIDKDREQNKIPTMAEMVFMAQQLIGGDDDGE